ncbi:MAG TPA: hypothetical protein VN788_16415 [Verrucomicrobiae bacterium]|nr:hypothetical protein [Verrucomicrobiae bacterium]
MTKKKPQPTIRRLLITHVILRLYLLPRDCSPLQSAIISFKDDSSGVETLWSLAGAESEELTRST